MAFRLYLPNTTSSVVTPAFDAAWTNTTGASRHLLVDGATNAGDGMAAGTSRSWTSGEVRLDRQYFSVPLVGGIAFSSAVTVRCTIRVSESNLDDNATARFGLRVCNEAGTIIRATLLAVADHGPGTEFATTAGTRRFAADAACATYTTQPGDRLVAEIGFSDAAGASPAASCVYGTSVDDDAIYLEATTNNWKPWIQLLGLSVGLLPATAGSVTPYTVSPYTVRPC